MSFDSIDLIIDGDNNQIQKTTTQSSLNEEYLNDFLIETNEHIESIEMNIHILEKDSNNAETIDSVFRDFHTIKGLAGFVSQGLVQKIAHQTETVLDKCRKKELVINNNIIQFILKSTDYIKNLCENLELSKDKDFNSNISTHLNQIENLQDNIINFHTEPQKKIPKKQTHKEESVYVRIPMRKIDALVDMVGELVINHSQFEQLAQVMLDTNDKLSTNLHRVSTLTKDIQNLSMSLRMVSLNSVFQRIYRIGKDTVSTLGKNAEFSLYGEETEIDRGVVEKLIDPLIHLMKNSIYHGIEDEAERIKKGKPIVGHVAIEAYSTKGNVYIVISDDGRGIDTQAVLKKAIKKDFASPSIDYSNEDILDFLFLPGFSTLDKADDISGRGVGLDVVKTQISKLGGKIEIKNSIGQGCSFIMKLPINMAIIKGTVVEVAGTQYIIPTLSINTIFNPQEEQWVSVKGVKNMIKLRENIIPLINIDEILGLKKFDKSKCVLVVLESGQKLKALPVTRIVENRDIVVKSLGVDFDNIAYAFGASILGNGRIAIIFDIENLFQKDE